MTGARQPDPNFQLVFRKDGTGDGTHFPQHKLLHLSRMLSLHPGRLSKALTEAWKKRALSVHTSTALSAAFLRDQRKKICTTPGKIRVTLNQSDWPKPQFPRALDVLGVARLHTAAMSHSWGSFPTLLVPRTQWKPKPTSSSTRSHRALPSMAFCSNGTSLGPWLRVTRPPKPSPLKCHLFFKSSSPYTRI